MIAVCANRSGKTTVAIDVLCEWGTTLGAPNNRGILISSDHTVIEDNIINEFKTYYPELIDTYNSQKHYLRLKNGHTIWAVSPKNMGALEGKSRVAYIIIDEWITVPKFLYNAAKWRAIDLGAPFLIIGTPIVQDPEKQPVGLSWGRELFDMGNDFEHNGPHVPKRDRIISLKWGMTDNPHIKPYEIDKMHSDPFISASEKRCRLYGDFMDIGDKVFDEDHLEPSICGYRADELHKLNLTHYGLLDPAVGKKAMSKHDDTALVSIGIGPNWTIYVRECWADKLNFGDVERGIISRNLRYKYKAVGVEAVSFQEHYVERMRKSQLNNDMILFRSIVRHGGSDRKPNRWARLIPFLESGRLKFPVDRNGNFTNGTDKLIEQIKGAYYVGENSAGHDDCIDALADVCAPEMGIMAGTEIDQREERIQQGIPIMNSQEYALFSGASGKKCPRYTLN